MARSVAEGFGDRVRRAREVRGLTQGALDRALGKKTGDGYTNKIEKGERGKNPSDALVSGLVEALGANRLYLLEGVGQMFDAEPGVAPKRERYVERDLAVYASFEQWLAMTQDGKGLDSAIVATLKVKAKSSREASGDPGAADPIGHWNAEYRKLLPGRKTIDELRALTEDEFE